MRAKRALSSRIETEFSKRTSFSVGAGGAGGSPNLFMTSSVKFLNVSLNIWSCSESLSLLGLDRQKLFRFLLATQRSSSNYSPKSRKWLPPPNGWKSSSSSSSSKVFSSSDCALSCVFFTISLMFLINSRGWAFSSNKAFFLTSNAAYILLGVNNHLLVCEYFFFSGYS